MVLEPVDFHERSKLQHTNGWTALDRLVDAVVADPPSRQQVAGEVDAIAGNVTVPPPSDPKLQLDPERRCTRGANSLTKPLSLTEIRRKPIDVYGDTLCQYVV